MAEETEGTRLLRGDQRKGIIAMAIPIGVALLFQQLNNIIDSLWMSDLGGDALAAIGIVYPIFKALTGIGIGLGIGVSASIARSIGRGDHDTANRSAASGAAHPGRNSPASSAPNPPCNAKQTSVNHPIYWNVPPTRLATGFNRAATSGIESV